MPRKSERYHHGDLRQALLETAARIIREEGIHRVTMRRLSELTGVSRMAPYRHFADKNALLCAVAEAGYRRLRERNRPILERGGDALDLLKALALDYVEFALENPAHYRLMFGGEVVGDPAPELRAAAQATFDESLAVTIRACQELELLRDDDPIVLVNIAWSTLHGLALLLIDGQVRSGDMAHALRGDGGGRVGDDPLHFVHRAIDVMIAGLRCEA